MYLYATYIFCTGIHKFKIMYSSLMKGTLQPLILQLLTDNGRMYGYEMTLKVKELTKGKIVLTEGSLYPALQKLEAEGILKTEVEYTGNRPRKYYTLAPRTKSAVKGKLDEINDFIKMLNLIFKPELA
jgi:PadR family transcriptional regulator, regulatory protein PadR